MEEVQVVPVAQAVGQVAQVVGLEAQVMVDLEDQAGIAVG